MLLARDGQSGLAQGASQPPASRRAKGSRKSGFFCSVSGAGTPPPIVRCRCYGERFHITRLNFQSPSASRFRIRSALAWKDLGCSFSDSL